MFVLWKLTNLQGSVWSLLFREIMTITSLRRRSILLLITIWYIIFQRVKRWKFWMRRLQWIRNERSSRKSLLDRWIVKRAEDVILEAQKREKIKSTLLHWWTFVIFRMPSWTKVPKIQRSSRAQGRQCRRRFWFLCSIHRTRIVSLANDCCKSNGCYCEITRMRGTSIGRSICLYPGKNGRCSQIIENFKIGMSRHLDSSTTTQMA